MLKGEQKMTEFKELNMRINVDLKTTMSLWTAIKFRIAGTDIVKEELEKQIKKGTQPDARDMA